jgi:glycosyltransferase involved in cell wall biosynthesis
VIGDPSRPAQNGARPRAVHVLFFYPRGGSAQVARAIPRMLRAQGWDVSLVAGSLGNRGSTRAQVFFTDPDLTAVDYAPATRPGARLVPGAFHQPSYEDGSGSTGSSFTAVGNAAFEEMVRRWVRALRRAGTATADVLHLHHLTPANEAAMRAFPNVPRVGHLHGTELNMLRRIIACPPPEWSHAQSWAERLRRWARACERIFVPPSLLDDTRDLLGVDERRIVRLVHGVASDRFDRGPMSRDDRLAVWRDLLVERPRAWDASGRPGTIVYHDEDIQALRGPGPILVYVGRFTAVKRLPLLIRAYSLAQREFSTPAPLVIVGGHPGECEGTHPLHLIRDCGARDVFLAGWREHEELPRVLNAADVLVLASEREAFGLVLIEAMACGLPVIATSCGGPSTIVHDGSTGWLVPTEDEHALARALVQAVNDSPERTRRGEAAYHSVRRSYEWSTVAARVAQTYRDVATLR